MMSLFPIARYAESKDDKGHNRRKLILERVKADSHERKKDLKKRRLDTESSTFPPKKPKSWQKPPIEPSATFVKHTLNQGDSSNLPAYKCKKSAVEPSEHSTESDNIGEEDFPEQIQHVGNMWPKPYDPLKEFKTGLQRQKELTILGDDTEDIQQQEVRHKLPEWIEYPGHVSSDIADSTPADSLLSRLDPRLQHNLARTGVTKLFPVQKSIIPPLLFDTRLGVEVCLHRPNDICVCSPTGSGKTLAFALPILNALMQCAESATRALIVLPTAELAKQVQHVFFSLTKGCRVHCALLGGSKTLLEEAKSLTRFDKYGDKISPDVIICTPGRLVHYLETNFELKLDKLRFLVIDEADRILDQVKHSWIERLEERLPHRSTCIESTMTLQDLEYPGVPLQKLLFSATLSTDPEKLEVLHLFQPRLFTSSSNVDQSANCKDKSGATKFLTPVGLEEYRICCGTAQKPLLVISMIKKNPHRVLCFVGSTESSRRLALLLQEFAKVEMEETAGALSFTSAEFSSLLTKKERRRQLSRFKSGMTNVLVCSDAAARGLDVDDVQQVILYDAPKFLQTYIHRVGRTSRAGKPGTAYTFVCPNEVRNFSRMFKDAGRNFPQKTRVEESAELEKLYETALSRVQSRLSLEPGLNAM